jgi:hypothetical protein
MKHDVVDFGEPHFSHSCLLQADLEMDRVKDKIYLTAAITYAVKQDLAEGEFHNFRGWHFPLALSRKTDPHQSWGGSHQTIRGVFKHSSRLG